MDHFKNSMFPFTNMFKNNQFGFNPIEFQRQMIKQSSPMNSMSNSFPFNMAKQMSMFDNSNPFPFNTTERGHSDSSFFPFNMMEDMGDFHSFPFQSFLGGAPNMFHAQQDQNRQNSNNMHNQLPTQFPHSLIRDQNGNVDFNKIGTGIQTTFGLFKQMTPMMKMFNRFLR